MEQPIDHFTNLDCVAENRRRYRRTRRRYHGAPGDFLFVRAGTLDNPDAVTPDVHIFTRSKVPWLTLPANAPAFESFYKLPEVWRPESLARFRAVSAQR